MYVVPLMLTSFNGGEPLELGEALGLVLCGLICGAKVSLARILYQQLRASTTSSVINPSFTVLCVSSGIVLAV